MATSTPKKPSGRLSGLRARAATKAGAPAAAVAQKPATPPMGEQANQTSSVASSVESSSLTYSAAPVQKTLVSPGSISLARTSVPQAVQAQKSRLESVGRSDLFIDFTDADGGSASRVRTSIHVAPDAIDAMNALQVEEIARFGKAPKIYHYVELALTKFMPTAAEAEAATDVAVPVYEPISTVVSVPAKMVMRTTRKVHNRTTGRAVVKHWFYTQAVLRMVAERRAALGL